MCFIAPPVLLLVMQVQSCVLLVLLGLARQVLEGLLQTHLAGNSRGTVVAELLFTEGVQAEPHTLENLVNH